MEGDGRIQRLDQAVINRIAAGEVNRLKTYISFFYLSSPLTGNSKALQCHQRDG